MHIKYAVSVLAVASCVFIACSDDEGGPGSWESALDTNATPSSTRFTARIKNAASTAPQGFYEYVPGGYPGEVEWPLLIALHGIGENGNGASELTRVSGAGVNALIKNDTWPNTRPFVVLTPQHPGGGCPGGEEIRNFITWALENYQIDSRYVYLTGLSCGAIGGWTYLQQNLDTQIAAFVSVAGDGKGAFSAKGCELAKVGIWALHGDADPTVNVSGTNVPMDGLADCERPPAKETKKTIYPGVGHDSWSRTYDLSAGNDVFTWMLGFKRE